MVKELIRKGFIITLTNLTEEGRQQANLGIKINDYPANTMRGDIDLPSFIFNFGFKKNKTD